MNEVYVIVCRKNDGSWIERVTSVEELTTERIYDYYLNERGFDLGDEDHIYITGRPDEVMI